MSKIIAACLAASVLATPAYAGVNDRQARQQHRIHQGLHSGALTGREAARLERQQYRIGRAEARMRADGGGLNARERARLHHRQDAANANIYARKHNGWFR